MERQLKERLVGAAVLMAMAVILIPEMLSGPRRAPAPPAAPAAERSDGNLKRYTIDLNGAEAPAPVSETDHSNIAAEPPADIPVTEEAAPAVEAPPSEAESASTQPVPPEAPPPASQESSVAAPIETPAPEPVVQKDTPPPVETAAPPAKPDPAPAPATAGRRWAVQLMATASREEAQREAEDLRNGNYAAFVMPVQSGRSTLYRVRVGPFPERAQAEEALRKLKSVRSNPIVVAQP